MAKQALPKALVDMWMLIDPELSPEVRSTIFNETHEEFDIGLALWKQPWTYSQAVHHKTFAVDSESAVIAVEKSRIANDGKVRPLWRPIARLTSHGLKWMKITAERERKEAAARAEDEKKLRETEANWQQAHDNVKRTDREAGSTQEEADVAASEKARLSKIVEETSIKLCEDKREVAEAKKKIQDATRALAETIALEKKAENQYKEKSVVALKARQAARRARKSFEEIDAQLAQAKAKTSTRKRKAESPEPDE